MTRNKPPSQALRRLAEELLAQIAQEDEIPERDEGELATSLVRQWITYDGNATLFVSGHQIYFYLSKTPLGKPCIVPEPALPGWTNRLTEDWKIAAENLPDILEQLNRGQSVEVTNDDGLPLRLWVNPKEKSCGVEPVVQEPPPARWTRDHRKIAADTLEQQLGVELDDDEMEALSCSVARQWQKYEGHACLFVGAEQMVLTLTELAEGHCRVETGYLRVDLEALLCSLGFRPEVIPEVIARINLDQEIEFQSSQGVHSCLWHNPKTRRICVRAIDPVQPAVPSHPPPLVCPQCGMLLRPWRDGERQQLCPLCSYPVSLF